MSLPTTQAGPAANLNSVADAPTPPINKPERKPGRLAKFGAYLWVGAILGVIALAAGVFVVLRMTIHDPYAGPTFTAIRQKLLVTIVERGSLESAENNDITVRVRAGARGSTIIKWVADDGTAVKPGDEVVVLDDSNFQDSLKSKKNDVNKALAEWVQAATDCTFQKSQNLSELKTAEVNWIQSILDLRKYAGELAAKQLSLLKSQDEIRAYLKNKNGFEKAVQQEKEETAGQFTSSYLQDISAFESSIETAQTDKESWLDRAKWSERMVKKGLYSPSQADADASRLAGAEIAWRKAKGDLDIYRQFDLEKNVTKFWSAVKETERAMERVEIQANAKMEQKNADEKSKRSIYYQELDRQMDMEKDEKNYKMYAPQKGMVVYFVPEQSKGAGSQQSIVAQGEPVREGQKLMRIPNLQKMLVNARVHEAMVSKLKGEQVKATGYGDRLRLAFSFGRNDLFALASYYGGFEKIREKRKFKDLEHDLLYKGQEALIRVDAYPGKHYKGNVKSVATVASQADFLSSDVKVYQTMVAIADLEPDSRLKPGMSAEVTILADETSTPVLCIPVQSIVGNLSMAEKRKCFVLDDKGFPKERDIVVGKSSDKYIEVVSGIEEGEKVVLNPRALLPEKTNLKPGISGKRGGDVDEGSGEKKGGKKRGDGSFKKGGGSSEAPPAALPGKNPAVQRSENAPAPAPYRSSMSASRNA